VIAKGYKTLEEAKCEKWQGINHPKDWQGGKALVIFTLYFFKMPSLVEKDTCGVRVVKGEK